MKALAALDARINDLGSDDGEDLRRICDEAALYQKKQIEGLRLIVSSGRVSSCVEGCCFRALGLRLTVGQRILVPSVGVRFSQSQPFFILWPVRLAV